MPRRGSNVPAGSPGVAPWLSVLTPSFGYARFIADAVQSVRMQAESSQVEHVVADGGSVDGTVEYLRNHPDLLWFSEHDDGQSDALNKAFQVAKGDIVGWLNADEFYLEGAFDAVKTAFDQLDADVVYGDFVFVDEDARSTRLVRHHRFDPFILKYYGCSIASCSFFVRREILPDIPWDVNLKYIMDWDLYLSLLERGAKFHYMSRPLGAFRVHDARVTARPLALDSPERDLVALRHGLPASHAGRRLARVAGRARRIALKATSDGFRSERDSRVDLGRDCRWWLTEEPTPRH